MAEIVPESIPELQVMPWIFGFFIVTGLLVALLGRRKPLYVWTGAFVLMALVGLGDFYKWEYDYGHNLDPTAAIQVPGLSYQPPLIGQKQILNFTAKAWPGLGGWAAIMAGAIAVAVTAGEIKKGAADRRTVSEDESGEDEPPTPGEVEPEFLGVASGVPV